MAFTEQDQIDLMYAVVGAFDASPGRTIFNELAAPIVASGVPVADVLGDITQTLVDHPLFSDATVGEYPVSQTNSQFAQEWLTELLGARGDLVTGSLWDEAKALVVAELNGGTTRAEIVLAATNYLKNSSDPGFNTGFAAAAEALANKVEVALYQAVELELDIPGTTLDAYRAPIADVDDSSSSVNDAKAALDAIAGGDISDSNNAANSVAEDAELGAAVGLTADSLFTETGADVTYSLTDDAGGKFAINADTGVVSVAGALDAESATSHTITVQATTDSGATSTADFDIAVSDVNDNGVTITDIDGAANSVSENMAVGTQVGIEVDGSDDDISASSYTYSLSDDAAGRFTINASTGVITTAAVLDREAAASHNITAVATSNDGSSSSQTFTIEVNNVNEAPVATGTDLQTLQDVSVDGQVTATDEDGDNLGFSVSADPSNGSVNLNGDGTFTYVPNDGYAGSDSFDVTVSDGNGGSDTVTVNIDIADVADTLTVGVDNINLSGAGQLVTGNHLTYNPGDSINGGEGEDTLQLGITNLTPITLGSATVNGIENLVVSVDPIVPATPVTLQMTGWDDDLARVRIMESTGHNFIISDLQNKPEISIDDVSGNVMIDIDDQVVAASNDELDVNISEFGTLSSSSFGRGNIMVDNLVEILNLDDRNLGSAFASDIITLSGGFNTVNITGGNDAVDLTIQEVAVDTQADSDTTDYDVGGIISVAGTGITIDSTTFAGDLVADIDGAGSGIVNTGVGDDDLVAHDDLSGAVDTGDGADKVVVSDADLAGGSISAGTGVDNVQVWGDMTGFSLVDGEEDADTLVVTGMVMGNATLRGGEAGDSITVGGGTVSTGTFGVSGLVQGEDGADTISISNGISGVVEGGNGNDTISQNSTGDSGRVIGTISGGEDDDVITNWGTLGDNTLSSNAGTINGDSGSGNDTITQNDDMEEGSVINGGGGDDVITVNGDGANIIEGDFSDGASNLQNEARINGDDGDDTININAVLDGDVNGGNGNDTVTITDDHNEGSIDLEDGDDSLIYLNNADFTGDVESGPYSLASNDGSVDGGAGDDSVTLRTSAISGSFTVEVASDGTDPVADSIPDGTDFTSIETLNIHAQDLDTTSDTESSQFFDVNLQAFDQSLASIHIDKEDNLNSATNATTVNLGGYDSEAITVETDGNDAGTDVFLNIGGDATVPFYTVGDETPSGPNPGPGSGQPFGFFNEGTIHGLRDGSENLNLTLQGGSAFDIVVNDAAGIIDTNLVNNGSGARTVTLDGNDDALGPFNANDGKDLNVSGDNTSRLTISGIYQETYAGSSYAGGQTLTFVDDETGGISGDEVLNIATGAGDDVVNIVQDNLNLSDGSIDLGDGTDRLIVNEGTALFSLVDEDQVMKNKFGIEQLELRGNVDTFGSTLFVDMEDDIRDAGVRHIIASNDDLVPGLAGMGMVDLDIDADYNDPVVPGLELTVEVRSASIDIDNGTNVDMDLFLHANSGNTGNTPLAPTVANTTAVSGSSANFTEAGDEDVDVNIIVSGDAAVGTIISNPTMALFPAWALADPTMIGHVGLNVMSGELSNITLVDSNIIGPDNGGITMTFDNMWATNETLFDVDASGIANNDFASFVGVTKDTDGTNTGGLWFHGAVETDTSLHLQGTDNDDTLWGSQRGDNIEGNDGDDFIMADPGVGTVVSPGIQEVSTIDFDITDDVEAGDKYIANVGGATYTWTAALDSDTVIDAVAALVSSINGGSPAQVTVTGTIDSDPDADVSAAVIGDLGTIELTGIDLDDNFDYPLGEDFSDGEAINRPTAVVTVANETYDIGDVIEIIIDGNPPFTYTITTGLETQVDIAASLIADINAGPADVTASWGGGGVIEIRGNVAETKYAVSTSLNPDLVTQVATSKIVTVTYTDLEAGETASISFAGGITESAADVATLVAQINLNGTLSAEWVASVGVGDQVILTSVDTGSAAPSAFDFVTADIAGGDGGTATFVETAGMDAIVRVDNTDPTLSANAVCFELTDVFYDAGDSIDVTINGTTYSAVLPGVSGEDDVNHDPATAAAAAVAAFNATPGVTLPAGFMASAVGGVITISGADGAVATWSVAITDITQTLLPLLPGADIPGPMPEIIEIDYTGFAAAPGAEVTLTIGGTTYTEPAGVDVDTTLTALAAQVGGDYTGSYDPLNPGVVTITSNPSGVEPADSLDVLPDPTVSGAFYNAGDVIIDVNDLGDVLVPASQVLDFVGMTAEDGATVTFSAGPTINVPDSGSIADTLAALVAEIEAQTDWNATVTGGGTTITITSDTDLAAAEGFASFSNPLVDIDDLVYAAPVPAQAAIPETWTVTATTFDDAPGGNSVSVTFDTSLDGLDGAGDFSISANTWAELAANINASLGTIGPGISGAAVGGGGVIIYGKADGTASVPTFDIIPVAADGANGTIGAGYAGPTAPTAPSEWSQSITLPVALAAGTIVFVELSDGGLVEVTLPGVDPANAAAVAAALEVYFDANGGVFDTTGTDDGAQTATITVISSDPNNPETPLISIANVNPDGNEPYTDTPVAPVDPGAVGSPADPADIELDFLTNGVDGQTVQLTLAAGNVYQGMGPTINDAVNDLVANVNLDSGLHGWVATNTDGSDFIITGPLNGTPPAIAFVSAELISDAGVLEIQESWENLDNTDPALEFLSGLPNTDSVDTDVVVPVAAGVATTFGNDTVDGGIGEDTIFGMEGHDILNGEEGDDDLFGGAGIDQINGGDGNDLISGGDDGDFLDGGDGADIIDGDNGNDSLTGGNGNDVLNGGSDTGMDTLIGGAGSDTITGGQGRDIMNGGNSNDNTTDFFVFVPGDSTGAVGTTDQIQEFDASSTVGGGDVIQLDLVTSGSFLGNFADTTNVLAALNGGSGPVAGRTVYDTTANLLYVDVAGTGDINAAMTIEVQVIGDGGLDSSNVQFV